MILKSARSVKVFAVAAAIGLTCVGAASARTWAFGSGGSKVAAVKHTNEAARLKAKADGTCYRLTEEAYCKKDGGKWSCIAEVTSYPIDPGQVCRFGNDRARGAFPSLSAIDPWVVAKMAGVKPPA